MDCCGVWAHRCVRGRAPVPGRVYSMIEASEGGLFSSDDAGRYWTRSMTPIAVRKRDCITASICRPGFSDVV